MKKFLSFAKRRPIVFCLLAVIIGYGCIVGRYLVWPPVGSLVKENPESTAFIEYRKEQWKEAGKDVKLQWSWKSLKQISPHLQQAVVVAEDNKFRKHNGFDWEGIRDAFMTNLAKRRLSAGGSTISQQLAKNLWLSPEKSITRKLQEAVLTMRLEMELDKDRILEIYLNVVEWGDGVFGAEAAARHYFGVSAARLNKWQSASLAAMLPSPLKRTPNTGIMKRLGRTIYNRMH
ncbi:monofunctional biosynthetic peptidoglycan transglycosylase [Desulfovibrio sp. OttesenSCG-928-C06]|nr:monofunctional biosynthetic peptidoglycan transglycosylase [Desulfovibrio sp. OttesenSCG-928-C06]